MTTWNVGETKPNKHDEAYYMPLLRPTNSASPLPTPDIVVVSLQECSKKHKSNWVKMLLSTLNYSLLQPGASRRGNSSPYWKELLKMLPCFS